jgi:hypothetical protein
VVIHANALALVTLPKHIKTQESHALLIMKDMLRETLYLHQRKKKGFLNSLILPTAPVNKNVYFIF